MGIKRQVVVTDDKERKIFTENQTFFNQHIIKVLTGIRRCGKSVMLDQIKTELMDLGIESDQIIAINLESGEWLLKNQVELLYDYVKARINQTKKNYLFLDEIQEINGWERAVNAFLVDFDIDIYITGSNAKLLSGELATHLGGRYVEFSIYPFLYYVSAKSKGIKGWISIYRRFFKPIYEWAGCLLFMNPPLMKAHRKSIYQILHLVVLKDIVGRNNVRNIDLLQRILLFLMVNIGNPFSSSAVIKFLKNEKRSISQETIYNYINYCEAACFAHLVVREDIVGKQILKFQEKIYLTDHGFREVVYGNNERDIQQILENIVYLELLRRGYEVRIGKISTREVDFIAIKGNQREYYQVSYILAEETTIEREFSPLESITDNFPNMC